MSRDRDPVSDMQIASEDRVDMCGEFRTFIVVHGVCDVVIGAFDLDHLLARGMIAACTSLTQLGDDL